MALLREEEIRKEKVLDVAKAMVVAAKTAPKGHGIDNASLMIVEGDDIKRLSDKTKELGELHKQDFFLRDAENILRADAIVLAGTKIKPMRLKLCGMCGFKNCEAKDNHPNIPCVFNTGDLGIAMGSAVSVAMDHRVDNRIMYTIGQAALALNLLGEEVKIAYGIPLSATEKNPFFDRAKKK